MNVFLNKLQLVINANRYLTLFPPQDIEASLPGEEISGHNRRYSQRWRTRLIVRDIKRNLIATMIRYLS